jgi:hypothetical protein
MPFCLKALESAEPGTFEATLSKSSTKPARSPAQQQPPEGAGYGCDRE